MKYRESLKSLWVITFIMLLFAGCITSDDKNSGTTKVRVGDSLPVFSVTANDGVVYSNESLKGYVAVIVFFYTPCGDCKQAMPIINEVYERNKDNERMRWIAISRSEGEQNVAAYWEENHFSLPYSAQADRTVYDLFAYSGVPRIYITNRQGTVCATYDDSVPLDANEFESTIQTIDK